MRIETRALLIGILLVAGFLRLNRLGAIPPGLYRDEAMDGCNALEALETGRFQVFYPEDNGREGLYINVAAGFVRVWGNRAWVLRLPAAIFGILTVWGVYQLAAELESVPAGLLAAFFLATSFWHVLLSRVALRAIGGPLFLVWGLYLLMVGLRRRHLAIAILAGCVYGLGFYTYIAYRATPLLIAAVLVWGARRGGAKPAAAFAAVALAVAAPLMFYFAGHPEAFGSRVSQVSVFQSAHPAAEIARNLWRTARMFFIRGDANWRHNYAWRAEIFWPVAILLVIGAGIALRSRKALLAAWLVVGALPVVFSGEGVPHALRSLLMAPPVFILAAIGGQGLYTFLARKVPGRLLIAAATALGLVLCYEPYHTYFERWATDAHVPGSFDARAAEVAEQIGRLPPDVRKYVAVPAADPSIAQPVMFLTGSYTQQEQARTNIHYVMQPCREVAASAPQAHVFCLQ